MNVEERRTSSLQLQLGRNTIVLESQANASKEADHSQEPLESALALERRQMEQVKKELTVEQEKLPRPSEN